MKKWKFIWIHLDKESQGYLEDLNAYSDWITYNNHVMLVMNNGSEDAKKLYLKYHPLIDTEVGLRLTHIGIIKDTIAVKLYCKALGCNYISVIASAPGTNPKVSEIERWIPLGGFCNIKGRIELYE